MEIKNIKDVRSYCAEFKMKMQNIPSNLVLTFEIKESDIPSLEDEHFKKLLESFKNVYYHNFEVKCLIKKIKNK